VTQTQCKVCAVSLDDVERALSERFTTRPKIVALEPNSLEDIRDDLMRLARACDVEERGIRLIAGIDERMSVIAAQAQRVQRKPKPRVAAIEWPEPLMAAGNWVPQLISMLG